MICNIISPYVQKSIASVNENALKNTVNIIHST